MSILVSTDAGFTDAINTGVTLVDFWAEWCGPCQMMLPRLEELSSKVDGKAKVMKHNVDDEPETPSKFRIMSIPTIIIFKDGQPVEKFVGVQDVATLEAAIVKHV
jgi:thioredoxin 1